MKDLEKKLKECEEVKEEYLNNWKKERANLLNYRKEEEERIIQRANIIKRDFILELLNILDNLNIAENEFPKDLKGNKWAEGLLKIKDQILDIVKKEGVEEIKAMGKEFDPRYHEAVEMIEDGENASSIIIEEIKKGYLYKGEVLRASKVKVVK